MRFHAKYWLQLIWLIITQFQRWEFSTGKSNRGLQTFDSVKTDCSSKVQLYQHSKFVEAQLHRFWFSHECINVCKPRIAAFKKIVKSPWAADEDKFCQKKGAMMHIALHSSVYQTDDIDDDVGWLSSYEPVWARGWSIYRAEAHCGPPASLAQLNSVCFDFPGCWPSVLSILITITHKDGGVVYLQITLFINIYSWLLTLDLGQPLQLCKEKEVDR